LKIFPSSLSACKQKNVFYLSLRAANVLPCQGIRIPRRCRQFASSRGATLCGQVEVVPPTENQQPITGPSEIDAAACDFRLQMPCITLSAFKPLGQGDVRSQTTQNAEKTTSCSGGHWKTVACGTIQHISPGNKSWGA